MKNLPEINYAFAMLLEMHPASPERNSRNITFPSWEGNMKDIKNNGTGRLRPVFFSFGNRALGDMSVICE